MKVAAGKVEAFIADPPSKAQVILLYGPDNGLVRERAEKLKQAVIKDQDFAFRLADFAADNLKGDPGKLFDEAHSIYGSVDILVNNAALTYFIPVKDYVVRRWKRSWEVNVHAPFILSQLALQDMIPAGSGSIVNISSGAAIGPGRGPYQEGSSYSTKQRATGGTCYGAEKAALERFSQGLAQEVYSDGISITCVSPSQVVPTPGTMFHNLVTGMDDPRGEDPVLMARSALLLATEPLEKVTGRVTYSQQILGEFGWLENPKGTGVNSEMPGSGYSQI